MTTLEQVFERLERAETTYLVIGWTNGEAITECYSADQFLEADRDYQSCTTDYFVDSCAMIRIEHDMYSFLEYMGSES